MKKKSIKKQGSLNRRLEFLEAKSEKIETDNSGTGMFFFDKEIKHKNGSVSHNITRHIATGSLGYILLPEKITDSKTWEQRALRQQAELRKMEKQMEKEMQTEIQKKELIL